MTRSVRLEVVEATLHAERDSRFGVCNRGVQLLLVVGDEVLDLDDQVVRGPERVLDDAAHPGPVGDAHIDAERKRLILHHAEEVVTLSRSELRQQFRWYAPVRVLYDDHGLAGREPS